MLRYFKEQRKEEKKSGGCRLMNESKVRDGDGGAAGKGGRHRKNGYREGAYQEAEGRSVLRRC